MPFAVTQQRFRFYNDDGSITTATAAAAENTNLTITDGGGNKSYHLLIQMQETGGTSGATTDDWQLQYSKNAGAWTNVTTTSSNVKAFDSANLTDGGSIATGDFRLTAGTGTAQAGKISEDGLLDDFIVRSTQYSEILFTIQTVDADLAAGDTLDFRVLYNGATTDVTYSVTPRITNQTTGYTMVADAGAFTLTGTAAGLLRGYVMAASAASFTLTGTAAGLLRAYIMAADAAAFVLTGTDAALRRGYAMIADAGSFVLTGTATGLLRGYVMAANAASFVLTGTEALLRRAFTMVAEAGAFVLSFTDILTNKDRAYLRGRRRRRKLIDYGMVIKNRVGR